MSKFGQHMQEYFWARQGVSFIEHERGFIGWLVQGDAIIVAEFYVEPKSSFKVALSLAQQVQELGRKLGCKYFVGMNDTELPSYNKIKTLHKWFGMTYDSMQDTREVWVKEI